MFSVKSSKFDKILKIREGMYSFYAVICLTY